jgi:hypothetical protein
VAGDALYGVTVEEVKRSVEAAKERRAVGGCTSMSPVDPLA